MSLAPDHKSTSLTFSHGFRAHWQTIFPHVVRSVKMQLQAVQGKVSFIPSLDLENIPLRQWTRESLSPSEKDLIILSHGLEGAATSGYIQEVAKTLHAKGFDVRCWYMRGCYTKMNQGPLLYHSGFTMDLRAIVEQARRQEYRHIFLIGFSVGGNISLKLLGEGIEGVDAAVCFSTPLVLEEVSHHLSKSFGGFYMKRFLKSLKEKVRQKEKQYPSSTALNKLEDCQNFESFDEHFTAPMHGFKSAHDYYNQASSLHYLSNIKTPTLIVNACNDPFLTPSCFPEPSSFPHLEFSYPTQGGHCGFMIKSRSMAELALDFFVQKCNLIP